MAMRPDTPRTFLGTRRLESRHQCPPSLWHRKFLQVNLCGFLEVGDSLFQTTPLTYSANFRTIGHVPTPFLVSTAVKVCFVMVCLPLYLALILLFVRGVTVSGQVLITGWPAGS